jgi:hypothetical protein
MKKSMSYLVVQALQGLQHLYPIDYRYEYGEELLRISESMLSDTDSLMQFYRVVVLLLCDTVKTTVREYVLLFGARIHRRPAYIRYSSFAATVLFIPYATVCMYNVMNKIVFQGRANQLLSYESHVWIVYVIALPTISLVIIFFAFIVRCLSMLFAYPITDRFDNISVDALLLGVPLSLLTTLLLL